jgi:hypothetical protein
MASWHWNFGRSRWDSVMHHFTLGSCIEWSVELGRSWCLSLFESNLSRRSLAVTEWRNELPG